MRSLIRFFVFILLATCSRGVNSQDTSADSCAFSCSWQTWSDMKFPDDPNLHIYWRPYQCCAADTCIVTITPDCTWQHVCFSIYNHWGEIMFESEEMNFSWIITACKPETLIYVITFLNADGNWVRRQGHFVLYCEENDEG